MKCDYCEREADWTAHCVWLFGYVEYHSCEQHWRQVQQIVALMMASDEAATVTFSKQPGEVSDDAGDAS